MSRLSDIFRFGQNKNEYFSEKIKTENEKSCPDKRMQYRRVWSHLKGFKNTFNIIYNIKKI